MLTLPAVGTGEKTTSIVNLIKDSVEFSRSGSSIKCEISVPENLWPFDVDEGQISQVINNLVINAIKYAGRGTLWVSAANVNVDEKISRRWSPEDTLK